VKPSPIGIITFWGIGSAVLLAGCAATMPNTPAQEATWARLR
jgi:hypothetical protein